MTLNTVQRRALWLHAQGHGGVAPGGVHAKTRAALINRGLVRSIDAGADDDEGGWRFLPRIGQITDAGRAWLAEHDPDPRALDPT